jgi:hypothetical protein
LFFAANSSESFRFRWRCFIFESPQDVTSTTLSVVYTSGRSLRHRILPRIEPQPQNCES